MLRLFLLTICFGIACSAGAEVISFQDPATGDNPYPAAAVEDPQLYIYNTFQLDDLVLGPDGYFLESAVTYWFYPIPESHNCRLRTYSRLPDAYYDIDQYCIKEYCGVSGEYDGNGLWAVTIDLEGDFYCGTIWLASYVFVPYGEDQSGGGWWNANAEHLGYETNGSEEYVWHWGCYMPPYPGSMEYTQTADMSWRIQGRPVPEPCFLSFAAVAALTILRRRRGRA